METTAAEVPTASARIARDGVKDLFKVQNVLLDYVAAQNAIAFKFVRDRLKAGEASPAAALVDSVEEITEGVVAMQRSLVDFGEERIEREPVAGEAEAEGEPAKKRSYPTVPFGPLLRKNFEAAVAAQREILGLVEKQGKLGVKAAEEFARFSTGKTFKGLASIAKESVDNVIATQTSLADVAAKQNKESLALLADQERPLFPKTIAHAMDEGIDNLHTAQVKLLEIAGEMNARVYERAETPAKTSGEPVSTFAERIESGIEKLVRTQNDLLDAGLRAVNRTAPTAN